MRYLLTALAVLTLNGCSLLFPGNGGDPDPDVLFSGTSYGFCVGYCITELSVEGHEATLVYRSSRMTDLAPIQHQRTLSAAERGRLDQALDRRALRRADEVYGCPDCADGGAEWVGATWDDGEKRVTFEAHDTVDGLGAYIETMRDLRASFPEAPRR